MHIVHTEFGLSTGKGTMKITPSMGVFFVARYTVLTSMRKADLALAALLVPLDYLAVLCAAAAAYSLRFAPWLTQLMPVQFALTFHEYLLSAALVAPMYLLVFSTLGLYSMRPKRGIVQELLRVFLGSSAAMSLILALAFFFRELFDSRFIILAAWGLSMIFTGLVHLFMRLTQKGLRHLGINVTPVALIGKTKTSQVLERTLAQYPSLGFRTVATFSHFTPDTEKKLLQLRKEGRIEAILIANTDATREEILAVKAFSDNEHLTFFYSADVFSGSTLRPILHTFGDAPVIEVPKTPLDGWGAIYKRGFDIIGSLALIICSMPLQIAIAILLFLEQPGSILFRKLPNGSYVTRVGQHGKPFRYFKFRSMIKNAHAYRFDPNFIKEHGNMREGTPLFKLKNDPRVTKIGKFLRALSLDEIPEFYLVLFGKMSLVGPRPHLPEEVSAYKPHERRVLTIKPGITGLPQISGRANLDFSDEVRLDMHYIENWSPWLDIIILLKTPLAVIFKKGAY